MIRLLMELQISRSRQRGLGKAVASILRRDPGAGREVGIKGL